MPLTLTHSVGVRTVTRRPEQDGGDAGRREERRVGPVAHADRAVSPPVARARRRDHGGVAARLEGLAGERGAGVDHQLRVGSPTGLQQPFESASTPATVSPGSVRRSTTRTHLSGMVDSSRPPVINDACSVPGPSVGCTRRVASSWLSTSSASRIGPVLVIASMPRWGRTRAPTGRSTVISVQTNPLCAVAMQLGRLGDDGRVSVDVREDLLHADAGVLLVRDRSHDHLTGDAGRITARDQCRGQAGLHVVGPPPVKAVTVDARRERIGHAVDADRVGCPQSSRVGPPVGPVRTMTLGRPVVPSKASTCRPAARAQASTNPAMRGSPAAPSIRDGLIESISRVRRADRSPSSGLPCGWRRCLRSRAARRWQPR